MNALSDSRGGLEWTVRADRAGKAHHKTACSSSLPLSDPTTNNCGIAGTVDPEPQIGTKYLRRKTRRADREGDKQIAKAKVKSKGTRNAGRLKKMLDMPVDVFFEVASHMGPLDVLRLSRVSKGFRGLLLSQTSRYIWLAAMKNVDPPLPECPTHLNEVQYTAMMFDRTCSICGAGRALHGDFALGMRFCASCWKTQIVRGSKLLQGHGVQWSHQQDIFKLLPRASSDVHGVSDSRDTPYEDVNQYDYHNYYAPMFAEVKYRYQELRAKGDETAIREYIDERKAESLRQLNFRLAINKWRQQVEEVKRLAREQIIGERIEAIEEHLEQFGYGDSDRPPFCLSREFYRILFKPQRLTPRTWENLRPKLITILETEHERRRASRHADIGHLFSMFLDVSGCAGSNVQKCILLPILGYVADLPCMKALIDARTRGPYDFNISQAEFSAIIPTLYMEVEEQRSCIRRYAVDLLWQDELSRSMNIMIPVDDDSDAWGKRPAVAHWDTNSEARPHSSTDAGLVLAPDDDTTILDRATSLFSCGAASCASQDLYRWSERPRSITGLLEHWRTVHPDEHFSLEAIRVHPRRHEMLLFLKSLGMTQVPPLATLEELLASEVPQCSCRGFQFTLDCGDLRPTEFALCL
ncbi:hypothetical protein C8Q79DRAFT_1117631, partial [Trametes meyenii]